MNQPPTLNVNLTKAGLTIDCLFSYNRRSKEVQETIDQGIIDHWSGHYKITDDIKKAIMVFCEAKNMPPHDFDSHLQVHVHIRHVQREDISKRRTVRIYYKPSLFLPAHVASPFYRRLWGIFKTGQIESIGLNWSPKYPGYMVLPTQTPMRRLPHVAAHEAGHIFGLGDAYGAWYRFYEPARDTSGYMMRDNTQVREQEIAMLIRAHATGRMQYFPRVFRPSSVFKGLMRALTSPFKRISKKRNR